MSSGHLGTQRDNAENVHAQRGAVETFEQGGGACRPLRAPIEPGLDGGQPYRSCGHSDFVSAVQGDDTAAQVVIPGLCETRGLEHAE